MQERDLVKDFKTVYTYGNYALPDELIELALYHFNQIVEPSERMDLAKWKTCNDCNYNKVKNKLEEQINGTIKRVANFL